jgi:hypothetical protein
MNLPLEFSDLQDLANRFAISDDLDRQSAIDESTQDEKSDLVARLQPRFVAINAYLDEHDDESAHLLGRLAEAACEVQIELNKRT